MSKQDFKRECRKYGHLYAINDFGQPTKDGVVTEGMRFSEDGDGNIIVCDYSAVIGTLKDFGYLNNPQSAGVEIIDSKKVTLPDEEIDLITRTIYRNEKGMYCVDAHNIYQKDGVTKSEKHKWTTEAAPFEML